MIRNRLQDCINTDINEDFTIVPKSCIRNPHLSFKAKGVLNILLSNAEGWVSFKTEILKHMQEGSTVLETALQELEDNGYLARIRYRQTNPNRWAGSFWCYTSKPFVFDQKRIDENVQTLINKGFQLQPDSYNIGTYVKEAILLQSVPNNNNIKKIKGKTIKDDDSVSKQKNITPSLFERFWKLYPKKVDKGKCKTKWESLCRNKNKPIWQCIKLAIYQQKQTDRWKKGYIPHPHTWLNQSRWLDDPVEMKDWKKEKTYTPDSGINYNRVDEVV